MKNLPQPLLRAFVLLCCVSCLSAQTPQKDPARGTRAAEAQKARMAHAASKDYTPYDTNSREAMKHIDSLFEKSDFTKVVETADAALKRAPFSIRLLMAKAAALRELKQTEKADEVRNQWIAVADSILNNGDGKTFQTAWVVINVDEEYDILRLLGLRCVKQSLVANGGSQYDQMELTHEGSGKSLTLYFNVDLPMKALSTQLSVRANAEKATPTP